MSKHFLVVSGSNRIGSYNTMLAYAAAEQIMQQGASAEVINLSNYPMPLFNQDLENSEGLPESVIQLKAKAIAAHGFFIACPEYNSSITPLLKNTLDWLSRKQTNDEAALLAFSDKSAAICSASPGALGGIRALVPLRLLLSNLGVNVVGRQLAIGNANQAFGEAGQLLISSHQSALAQIITTLIRIS